MLKTTASDTPLPFKITYANTVLVLKSQSASVTTETQHNIGEGDLTGYS